MTGSIILKNGQTFHLSHYDCWQLEHTKYKNLAGLLKAVRQKIQENCSEHERKSDTCIHCKLKKMIARP